MGRRRSGTMPVFPVPKRHSRHGLLLHTQNAVFQILWAGGKADFSGHAVRDKNAGFVASAAKFPLQSKIRNIFFPYGMAGARSVNSLAWASTPIIRSSPSPVSAMIGGLATLNESPASPFGFSQQLANDRVRSGGCPPLPWFVLRDFQIARGRKNRRLSGTGAAGLVTRAPRGTVMLASAGLAA